MIDEIAKIFWETKKAAEPARARSPSCTTAPTSPRSGAVGNFYPVQGWVGDPRWVVITDRRLRVTRDSRRNGYRHPMSEVIKLSVPAEAGDPTPSSAPRPLPSPVGSTPPSTTSRDLRRTRRAPCSSRTRTRAPTSRCRFDISNDGRLGFRVVVASSQGDVPEPGCVRLDGARVAHRRSLRRDRSAGGVRTAHVEFVRSVGVPEIAVSDPPQLPRGGTQGRGRA